jgi:hypothetical protein
LATVRSSRVRAGGGVPRRAGRGRGAPGRAAGGAGSADHGDGRTAGRADRGQRGSGRESWPGWSICCRGIRGTPRARRHATTTRASQRRRRRSGATAGRDGRGANNPGRRGRTWRGPTTRTSGVIGSCRVAATAGMTRHERVIWEWSTATSPTRSHRSRCGSSSTTSTRCGVSAGGRTPPPGRTGPGPTRSATARTWPRSRCKWDTATVYAITPSPRCRPPPSCRPLAARAPGDRGAVLVLRLESRSRPAGALGRR